MLSRKSKDKTPFKEGVVGKYIKKDTPSAMPSKLIPFDFHFRIIFERWMF